MNPELLTFLQWALLLVDGAGIFASFDRMKFYRKGKHHAAIFKIYAFFFVLFWVFLALAFSDLCVVMKWPSVWWATLPIIRGHIFRTPVVIALLWMIHEKNHGPTRQ